jgi:hypothetical protein
MHSSLLPLGRALPPRQHQDAHQSNQYQMGRLVRTFVCCRDRALTLLLSCRGFVSCSLQHETVGARIAAHIVEGQRSPVAVFTCLQRRLVSPHGEVTIIVESNITFAPLSGDWGVFADCLLGDITR